MSERDRQEERRLRQAAATRYGVVPEAERTRQPGPTGQAGQPGQTGQPGKADEDDNDASARMEQKALWVDLQVQKAIDRGAFDDLPGAGKPLHLPDQHDPDWWVKRLVEREKITGIAPPAIGLRQEDAELDAALDREFGAEGVRRAVEDFNRRVVEARRQLTGGPPVVTRTREVEVEIARWRERRETARQAARQALAEDRRRREAEAEAQRSVRRDRMRRILRRPFGSA